MKLIKINSKRRCDLYALVDDEDYEELSRFNWHLDEDGYAERTFRVEGKRRRMLMHRQLLNAPRSLVVDHRDGDRLNNTRSNIRMATRQQNNANVKHRHRNKVGIKGAYKVGSRWMASINVDGRSRYLGTFSTPEEAGRAYDSAAIKAFGVFARLNAEVRNDKESQRWDSSARPRGAGNYLNMRAICRKTFLSFKRSGTPL